MVLHVVIHAILYSIYSVYAAWFRLIVLCRYIHIHENCKNVSCSIPEHNGHACIQDNNIQTNTKWKYQIRPQVKMFGNYVICTSDKRRSSSKPVHRSLRNCLVGQPTILCFPQPTWSYSKVCNRSSIIIYLHAVLVQYILVDKRSLSELLHWMVIPNTQ